MHVQRAQQLGAATDREKMFIAMAAAFFDPSGSDYWSRINRWESAARDLFRAYPADLDAAAFYCLAHLATSPPGGGTTHQDSVAKILAGILARQPAHPGAVHYLIHANDAAGREHESLDVVGRYAEIAPHNPHALHMPTHIFVRLGNWPAVIEGNLKAADAALEHPAGDQHQWVWDEFPHALEYLIYAALQRGDDSTAYNATLRLQSTPSLEPSFKTAFHLSSIPARYALERQAWAEAARLQPRPVEGLEWDRFPWPEAITWYARGLGAVRSGNPVDAALAERRLTELRGVAEQAGETLFARNIEILRLQVAAWLAHANGSVTEALEQMRAAVTLEAETPKHAVTPAPTLPASEVLGDLLMEIGRPAEALAAYRVSLEQSPGRLNSLAGAVRAALAAGDTASAKAWSDQIRAQVVDGSPRRGLAFTASAQS
jgi:tetratricopeptide (TPR) repeat protein